METFKEILEVIVAVVIIPAIPVLAKCLVDALKEWSESKAVEIEDATIAGYLEDITDVIYQAVICTTQTYVDTLKAQGKFDEEAQKIAFEKTKNTVMRLLAEDAKEFIFTMYGDIDLWLDTKIEQMVNDTKDPQSILIAEA